MRGSYGYLLIGLLVVVIASAAGEISIRSFSCKACHRRQAQYVDWMTNQLKIQNKGFSHALVACADCHIKGSPQNTILSRGRAFMHAVTYLTPQIDPRETRTTGLFHETRVPSENCQCCHYAAIYRKEVYLKDLPKGLKEIGLVMDHLKHVVARDDTCAKCHERFRDKDDARRADKEVNYAEVNHLACDSCHVFASHDYQNGHLLPLSNGEFIEARQEAWHSLSKNPRWMVSIPTERSCKRCHNGNIHYKTRIFPADCRQGDDHKNCLKCHPIMTPEYFDRYMKKRKTTDISSGVPHELYSSNHSYKNDVRSTSNSKNIGQSYGRPENRLELNFPNSTMNWSDGHANSKR